MTPAAPAAARQLGGAADLRSLEARMKEAGASEPVQDVYTSTAFMNYVKPVIGSKKFSAASLASSASR